MNTLTAKEGMYLTQNDDTITDRVYATEVMGIEATYEYWRDATEEEKTEYENEQELKMKNDNGLTESDNK